MRSEVVWELCNEVFTRYKNLESEYENLKKDFGDLQVLYEGLQSDYERLDQYTTKIEEGYCGEEESGTRGAKGTLRMVGVKVEE